MPSTAIDSQIHGFLFSTDEMREIFSDRSWAQKWLDTEAEEEAVDLALAAAQAELGIISPSPHDRTHRKAFSKALHGSSSGDRSEGPP